MRQLIYRYRVRGSLAFPIDMLRYDRAFPYHERDSYEIERSMRHQTEGQVSIELLGLSVPTLGRWKSFRWQVDYLDRHGDYVQFLPHHYDHEGRALVQSVMKGSTLV